MYRRVDIGSRGYQQGAALILVVVGMVALLLMAGLALDGAKVAEVVISAASGDGIECLAVTSLEAWGRALRAEDGREAMPQPLPYAVAANA